MKEYSFLDVLVLVNGVEIGGFDEGDDVITLERLNDSASHNVSVDGEMVVSISADRSGSVTFRLFQTSESNDYLTRLISEQENGNFTPVQIQFKDVRGSDMGGGSLGYITRPANMVRGATANPQEWVIIVERLDLLHGGSPSFAVGGGSTFTASVAVDL